LIPYICEQLNQQQPVKKDRNATEERIYTSFLDLLEEKGPQGVGINAIAKKAGVSKELIYRYFGGMKGLLLQLAKKGDFFKSIVDYDSNDTSKEYLKHITAQGTKELRENVLAQELLRWPLIENNENTKELFKFTNAEVGGVFQVDKNNKPLNHAFQLMIGGYIYFTLLSKFNKSFISTDLHDEKTWDNFDEAIAQTIDFYHKKEKE